MLLSQHLFYLLNLFFIQPFKSIYDMIVCVKVKKKKKLMTNLYHMTMIRRKDSYSHEMRC